MLDTGHVSSRQTSGVHTCTHHRCACRISFHLVAPFKIVGTRLHMVVSPMPSSPSLLPLFLFINIRRYILRIHFRTSFFTHAAVHVFAYIHEHHTHNTLTHRHSSPLIHTNMPKMAPRTEYKFFPRKEPARFWLCSDFASTLARCSQPILLFLCKWSSKVP